MAKIGGVRFFTSGTSVRENSSKKLYAQTRIRTGDLCCVRTAGLFLLEYGVDRFIDHTVTVAPKFGVSQTLVALLTVRVEWEEVHYHAMAQMLI